MADMMRKKRRQEETNCLQTARAVLTEIFWLVWTNRKGHKLWQCCNVPFTELHSPLFNFPLVFKKGKKKLSCPLISAKVALEAAISKGAWAVYHNYHVFMQQGDREAVSDLATVTALLPSCGSARRAKICTIREKTAGVNSPLQRYAGWQSKRGQQRRQYGEQLAQDILLAALCLAYHNRGSGRFPNNGRGWEDGREREREWESRRWGSAWWCVFKMNLSICCDTKGRVRREKKKTHKHSWRSSQTNNTTATAKGRWSTLKSGNVAFNAHTYLRALYYSCQHLKPKVSHCSVNLNLTFQLQLRYYLKILS